MFRSADRDANAVGFLGALYTFRNSRSPAKMAKIMDPVLPILSILEYRAIILGSFGGPGMYIKYITSNTINFRVPFLRPSENLGGHVRAMYGTYCRFCLEYTKLNRMPMTHITNLPYRCWTYWTSCLKNPSLQPNPKPQHPESLQVFDV